MASPGYNRLIRGGKNAVDGVVYGAFALVIRGDWRGYAGHVGAIARMQGIDAGFIALQRGGEQPGQRRIKLGVAAIVRQGGGGKQHNAQKQAGGGKQTGSRGAAHEKAPFMKRVRI